MYLKSLYSSAVIPIHEKELWNKYVRNALNYDFYHTWDYHSIETSGTPFLFVYYYDSYFIAMPLIKRKIEDSPFFDCTSVYGYTGPISNLPEDEVDESIISGFHQYLLQFLRSERIVTVFSRLHPLYNQEVFFRRLGGIYDNGETVAVNLQPGEQEIRSKYRKAIRQKINQLRRDGFVVRDADSLNAVNEFSEIYRESMINLKATARYLYDNDYFYRFLSFNDFESKLLLCYYQGAVTAGALITFSGTTAQIHLAATRIEYLHFSPMKLLFDEAIMIAKSKNMKYIHLGSGVGGERDSLFHFKCGFSNLTFKFPTWRYIVDIGVYNQLVSQRKRNEQLETTSLFPLYRFV